MKKPDYERLAWTGAVNHPRERRRRAYGKLAALLFIAAAALLFLVLR